MTVNVLTGVGMLSLTVYAGVGDAAIAGVCVGALVGTLITPDYDFEKNLPKSIIGRIPLLGYAWNVFWLPYAKLVKHRSFVSHSPIASTLIRAGYLYVGITLFFLLFNFLTGNGYVFDPLYISSDESFWLFFLGAWCVQDLSHLLLDTKLFRIFKGG